MRLNNMQMFNSIQVLRQAKEEKGLLGYAIAVNLRKLSVEAQEFLKKRDELLKKHSGQSDEHGRFLLVPAGAEAFRKELQPYAELETEVAIMQVMPEVFYGGNLTSAQMYELNWMVKEE